MTVCRSVICRSVICRSVICRSVICRSVLIVGVLTSLGVPAARAAAPPAARRLLQEHCVACHDASEPAGKLDLSTLQNADLAEQTEEWERVVRKLRTRQMPPVGEHRPTEAAYDDAIAALTSELDRLAAQRPAPGRTSTFRRLTRYEYQNVIRDLLALEVEAAALLPVDPSSQGFDNITVDELSPTLLNRYLSAAERISRLAVGVAGRGPSGTTVRIRPDITQEGHLPGLPLGTRGGALVAHTFSQDGEYDVRIRLARDRNEHVEGLRRRHSMEVLLDRRPLQTFAVRPPEGEDHSRVDSHLHFRLRTTAGLHKLGVTFLRQSAPLLETKRQPYRARFNMHRHPRTGPAVFQITITGPYDPGGPGDTLSRRKIFLGRLPSSEDDQDAAEILRTLLRRAWRRPPTDEELDRTLAYFEQGRDEGGFEAGVQFALASILVNPRFLFRIERDPPELPTGTVYEVGDFELATRLSFFLWSSIPDDELLQLAVDGALRRPDVLRKQTLRMLADPRSRALSESFAAQWLQLRNLDGATPNLRLFADFDDNLRQAMRKETELLFDSIVREDRSVLDLLRADYTFLNERLARHYEIPHVVGSRFRRVALGPARRRGGLLRQGSVLTVTSYATRTSPVLRGQWVLKTLVGSPPPPPPDDVPALTDNTVDARLSMRQRLASHRANPQCAGCHNLMDPAGLSLENFDAVGRWRAAEGGQPVDASGGLPDGSRFTGVAGLEQALLKRPELLAGTLSEKLLTYALGRGMTPADAPAVRRIVREAAADDYRFSTLVLGIVQSPAFRMRTTE